ncbi:MAG TPA: hypothetical protein ENH70_08805 [Desulfobacteraceae bacterium]|nr:hypothetical protein [Desulfobacteraceae bacterium]
MSNEKRTKWLARLSDVSEVIRLVRGDLGCACPLSVFEHYQVAYREEDPGPLVQVIVGDRLLLWIVDGTDIPLSASTLSPIITKGCKERDRRGLNRFRLVLEGMHSHPETLILEQIMAPYDSRTHIHFL